MELYSALVTRANRGIGLEVVKQLIGLPKPPRYVFATYRPKENVDELSEVKKSAKKKNTKVKITPMDVSKLEDIMAVRKIVEKRVDKNGLTLLVYSASIAKMDVFPNITEESLLVHFNRNTIAPIRILQEMFPLLKKSASMNSSPRGMRASRASVLNIVLQPKSVVKAGVESPLTDMDLPSFQISKAALNMGMRVIASNVHQYGILIVNMSVGCFKKNMDTEKDLTDQESIPVILGSLAKLDESHHGTFMDRLGNPATL